MHRVVLLVTVLYAAVATAQQGPCSFQQDGYQLSWEHDGQFMYFTMQTPAQPSSWSGVGFGDSMAALDFVEVAVGAASLVRITDKQIDGYSASSVTASPAQTTTAPQPAAYANGAISARFQRPIRVGRTNLAECTQWQFPVGGGGIQTDGTLQVHARKPIGQRVCAGTCLRNQPAQPSQPAQPQPGQIGQPNLPPLQPLPPRPTQATPAPPALPQPVQPVQPVQPIQPIQPGQPIQPVQTVQPVQPQTGGCTDSAGGVCAPIGSYVQNRVSCAAIRSINLPTGPITQACCATLRANNC